MKRVAAGFGPGRSEGLSVPTIVRYAVSRVQGDPPLREVAQWIEPVALNDARAVTLDGYDGEWILLAVSEPLADLSTQVTPTVFNRFNEVVEAGGFLIDGGTRDLYALPLTDGYELVDEDTYVTEWNKVAGAGQKIPDQLPNVKGR